MTENWTLELTGPYLQLLFPIAVGFLIRGVLATVEDIANLIGRILIKRSRQ